MSRLQYPPQKIRIRHIRRSSYDQHSSHSSNTLSSNSTTRSVRSNATVGNESQRSPSPDRTRHRNDTSNAPESLIPSRPSTPRLISGPPSLPQPGSPRTSPQTHLGMRKRSTLRDETAPVEINPTIGNDKLDLDNSSHEQEPPHPAEIIVSPPTPSSSVFLHSAPGPSEGRFGYVSTAGKPAARFVKSHSKRHSLSAACPRKSSFVGHPTIMIVGGDADDASDRQTQVGQAIAEPIHSQLRITCNDPRGRVEMAHFHAHITEEETKIITNRPTPSGRCVSCFRRGRR